jgi:hypothetical protein
MGCRENASSIKAVPLGDTYFAYGRSARVTSIIYLGVTKCHPVLWRLPCNTGKWAIECPRALGTATKWRAALAAKREGAVTCGPGSAD